MAAKAIFPRFAFGGRKSATTCTAVTVGTDSTSILAANHQRLQAIICNDSNATIYLALATTDGATPSASMNSGIMLPTGASITLDGYEGAVHGISAAGSKVVTVVDI